MLPNVSSMTAQRNMAVGLQLLYAVLMDIEETVLLFQEQKDK